MAILNDYMYSAPVARATDETPGIITAWVKGLVTIGFILIIWYMGNATIFADAHGVAPTVENVEENIAKTPFSGTGGAYWFWNIWPYVAVIGVLIYMAVAAIRRRTGGRQI